MLLRNNLPMTSDRLLAIALDYRDETEKISKGLGLGNGDIDIREGASNIVAYLLSFLGLLAVIIILYGGYLWMTSAGNEDQIDKAKETLKSGVIGLIVILSALAIAVFVSSGVMQALSGQNISL